MQSTKLTKQDRVSMLTPLSLQTLIKNARAGNKAALQQLCQHFSPLIHKESQREAVYRVLGEDAKDIAWEYFLYLIQSYQGQNYQQLPGYVKLKLHYHLLHLLERQGNRWKHEVMLEDMTLLSPIADEENKVLTKITYGQIFQGLQPQQQQLILLLEQERSQQQIAQQLHCSTRTVQRKIQQMRHHFSKLAC